MGNLIYLALALSFFSCTSEKKQIGDNQKLQSDSLLILKDIPYQTELYGFKLGQYREVAKNELGKRLKYEKYTDGFIYEIYALKPDTSLYIIFEYAASDTNTIWSIQVSGPNTITDIGFKNIKLGIDTLQIEKLFGSPSSKEDAGEYGQRWDYKNTNFSFEVNLNGKLSSVKILDHSNELFPSPEIEKIPSFDKIQKTLNSNNNADILNLLTGDFELYSKEKTYYFKKSFATEKSKDDSKLISLIRKLSKDLASVDIKNEAEYEENMRLAVGQDIKHVIKIKKGHAIKEIVLKYYGGQYYIYEISAN